MNYTEGQIQILRERLNAYRLNEAPAGKKALGWNNVSEHIKKLTGTHIPEESLRQFVRPKNRMRGAPPRKLGSPGRYDAIRDFLSDKRIGYLSEHELDEKIAPYHAAFSLAAFLGCEEELDSAEYQRVLTGSFFAEMETDIGLETIELQIDAHGQGGLIRVSEVNILEDLIQELDRVEFSGWAVYRPNGFLVIFLKDPMTQSAHCYFALLGENSKNEEGKIDKQVLYRYRGPFMAALAQDKRNELGSANEFLQPVRELFPDHCIYFERRF